MVFHLTLLRAPQEMVAVERILQYLKIQPQADVLPIPEAAGSTTGRPYGGLGSPQASSNHLSAAHPMPAPTKLWPAFKASAVPAAAPPVLQILDVYMRYSPGLPFALAGLSLTVAAGERLGVVGRTGAGKSSLVAVILRLVEVDSGERGLQSTLVV